MKNTFFKILTIATAAFLVSLISSRHNNTDAATLSIPNSFSSGQKIVASYMNQNFQAIASWSSVIASDNIIDGGISSADIATSAIITAKIADLAVTTAKLADGAVTAAKLGAVSYYWSGYHLNDCTWSTTSPTLGSFTPDSSCTFTERSNGSIGTVSAYFTADRSSGQNSPGLTFTPPKTGPYRICATFHAGHSNSGSAVGIEMLGVNASSSLSFAYDVAAANNNGTSMTLCGIYVSDTASATRSIVMRGGTNDGTGTAYIGLNSFSGGLVSKPQIEWTIQSL